VEPRPATTKLPLLWRMAQVRGNDQRYSNITESSEGLCPHLRESLACTQADLSHTIACRPAVGQVKPGISLCTLPQARQAHLSAQRASLASWMQGAAQVLRLLNNQLSANAFKNKHEVAHRHPHAKYTCNDTACCLHMPPSISTSFQPSCTRAATRMIVSLLSMCTSQTLP
jgi:hypothetical protein